MHHLTPVLNHALNALERTSLDIFGVVKEVRQAIAHLQVQVHVAFDSAVLFHVAREESETKNC